MEFDKFNEIIQKLHKIIECDDIYITCVKIKFQDVLVQETRLEKDFS